MAIGYYSSCSLISVYCFVLSCLVLSSLQPSSIRWLVASCTSLLHFLLSLVFFNRSLNGIPVHCSMLSIRRILGFPCFLAPSVVPCMISSPDNHLLFS